MRKSRLVRVLVAVAVNLLLIYIVLVIDKKTGFFTSVFSKIPVLNKGVA